MNPISMLKRNTWQRVPGWNAGEVFPIVIRPGVVCSNSFLFDTARAMIVIDPGTDPEQIELINRTLADRPDADSKPVIVILTHCHQDHSQGADQIRTPPGAPNLLLVEASGAEAMRSGNRERTLALLYPDQPAVCTRSADVDLFAPVPGAGIVMHAGARGELRLSTPVRADPLLPARQSLQVDAEDFVEVFHTPGHTPCSICIRAGGLLMVGDLPFAADPGLIGIDGWNQKDLLASFDAIQRLLRGERIDICCPGHGNPIAADVMYRTLTGLLDEAMDLEEVDAMDPGRLTVLKEFARELLDEAEYLFSVISGRLYTVSFHLAEIEEADAANRFAQAVDLDKIDRVLSGFRSFHDEFSAAAQPTLALVMKGVQTARAIEQMFAAQKLHGLLEASLIRRASRLLADYVELVRGLRFTGTEATPDLNRLLTELIEGLDITRLDGDAFIDSADDAEAYLMGLVARLAFPPAFRHTRIEFEPAPGEIAVPVAPDRLGDMIVSLMESLAAGGATAIRIAGTADDASVRLHICGAAGNEAITVRRLDIARRMLAPVGGRIESLAGSPDGDCFRIELPRLGAPATLRAADAVVV